MQMKRDYVYYSVSLLFDANVALMEEYLRHPPHEPAYRRKRAHDDFVMSIIYLGGPVQEMDMKTFITNLFGNLDIHKLG